MPRSNRSGFRRTAGFVFVALSMGFLFSGTALLAATTDAPEAKVPTPVISPQAPSPEAKAQTPAPPATDVKVEEETINTEGVPKRPALSRYQAIMDGMPFGNASAELKQVKEPNYAQNLYISGIGSESRVYITTKDKSASFTLSPEREHDGIELVKVNWQDGPGETTVTVRKAGELAELKFDQAAMSTPSANTKPTTGRVANNNASPKAQPARGPTATPGQRTPPKRPPRIIRTRPIRSTP